MLPPYIFKVDELRENPAVTPLTTRTGHWIPHTTRDYNYRSQEGVTGLYWFCENTSIRPVPGNSPPQPLELFKTYSIFFSAGRGFWVLRGDGTDPGPNGIWHPLRFEHGAADKSSYLTEAGTGDTLDRMRTDQAWTHMLLPNIYHGRKTTTAHQGGLRGELPIFLALIAMSIEPQHLLQYLPWMFQDSQWRVHDQHNGWTHKRGVVVNVYTCPSTWGGGSTPATLEHLENGGYGKYYN